MSVLRRVLTGILVCVLVSAICISAAADSKGFKITVDNVFNISGYSLVTIKYENQTGNDMSLGWVNSCDFIITTNEEELYFDVSGEISRGTTIRDYTFEHKGEIRKIVISDLRGLDDRGLPESRLKDVVIYDADKGVNYYEGKFGFFDSSNAFVNLMMIIVPFVMLGIIITVIVVAVKTKKRNANAMRQFNPYGGNAINNNDAAMRMHMDAVNQANATHQRFVNQQAIDQHNHFAQQSVTSINEGGFIPPPPPPPPPTM